MRKVILGDTADNIPNIPIILVIHDIYQSLINNCLPVTAAEIKKAFRRPNRSETKPHTGAPIIMPKKEAEATEASKKLGTSHSLCTAGNRKVTV